MSNSKQCSDAAQKGPGLTGSKLTPRVHKISGGIGSAGNTKSGTSQSANRGKQGNG
jgi:hypothetical protein